MMGGQAPKFATDLTGLLAAWTAGEAAAKEQVWSLVYEELRRLARRRLREERAGHTIESGALVNEAYLKLAAQRQVCWRNRTHFFALAAQIMRRILVDHARRRNQLKRGGGAVNVPLDEFGDIEGCKRGKPAEEDVLALDAALEELASFDPRKARLVELRFFASASIDEAAAALGVSPGTAMRDWTLAKAWLKSRLRAERD